MNFAGVELEVGGTGETLVGRGETLAGGGRDNV